MKAIMMVCNRSFSLRTIFGSIAFKENEPTLVSPQMVEKALSAGVLPCDADEELFEREETEQEPTDPGTRGAAITRAVENIFARNNPDEFTTGSSPKVVAVAKEANLSKIGAHEIKAVLDLRNKHAFEKQMEEAQNPVVETNNEPPDDER